MRPQSKLFPRVCQEKASATRVVALFTPVIYYFSCGARTYLSSSPSLSLALLDIRKTFRPVVFPVGSVSVSTAKLPPGRRGEQFANSGKGKEWIDTGWHRRNLRSYDIDDANWRGQLTIILHPLPLPAFVDVSRFLILSRVRDEIEGRRSDDTAESPKANVLRNRTSPCRVYFDKTKATISI